MSAAFPELLIQRMDVAKEVDIETAGPDGTKHRVTIWIVVVDRAPYVRSVRGTRGRWYRELIANSTGALRIAAREAVGTASSPPTRRVRCTSGRVPWTCVRWP